MLRRLRRTNDSLSDLVFSDVPGRVAKALLDLADRFGRPATDGVLVGDVEGIAIRAYEDRRHLAVVELAAPGVLPRMELRPRADASTRYTNIATLEWARQWPSEEAWIARKRG